MADGKIGARIVGNISILTATQLVTKALGTVFTIFCARKLGVEDYGFFVFASTIGGMLALFAGFGLPQLVTRKVARDIEETGDVLGSILVLEVGLSILAFFPLVGILLLLQYPPHRILIVSIAGIGMILSSVLDVIAAFFRAHQRMELEGVMRISFSVLNLGFGLVILLAGYGLVGLVTAQLAAFVFVVSLGMILVLRYISRPSFSSDWRSYQAWLVKALPFALSGIFIFVYDGTAVIFLSIIKGDQATGLYSGAMNFVKVFGLLPAGLVAAFLPVMAQVWRTSPERWRLLCGRSLKYLLIIALPIATGLILVSDKLVLLILGRDYTDSALILRMAASVIILAFLNHGFSNAMISIDREKTFMRIVGVMMVFNVASNLILISIWGAYGAVAATVLTEALMLLTQFWVLSKSGLNLSLSTIAPSPVLSVVIMALGVYLASSLNLIVVILLGAAIYLPALFILRAFDDDETRRIIRLVQRVLGRLGFGGLAGGHIPHGGSDV